MMGWAWARAGRTSRTWTFARPALWC